jgi:hypothetical protein
MKLKQARNEVTMHIRFAEDAYGRDTARFCCLIVRAVECLITIINKSRDERTKFSDEIGQAQELLKHLKAGRVKDAHNQITDDDFMSKTGSPNRMPWGEI